MIDIQSQPSSVDVHAAMILFHASVDNSREVELHTTGTILFCVKLQAVQSESVHLITLYEKTIQCTDQRSKPDEDVYLFSWLNGIYYVGIVLAPCAM